MRQKRIVTIQDISCFGKCSLTVALPIISAMGVETAIIPTAVLSTHTGGFKDFTFRDLTQDIKEISAHWKSINLDFDVIYTGYLGSFEQLNSISAFIDDFKTDKNIVLIDPAMGDNGSLYTGFSAEFAIAMGKLCKKADIIVPNLTEAAFMLGEEYISGGYDEKYIHALLKRLSGLGCKNIILTGVSYSEGQIGAVSYDCEKDEYNSYFTELLDGMFHGTGDIFASVCAGAISKGYSLTQAMELSVDFVYSCITATIGHEKEHWYGVRFEDCLHKLSAEMCKNIK